jgi:molecular chaperone GrpE
MIRSVYSIRAPIRGIVASAARQFTVASSQGLGQVQGQGQRSASYAFATPLSMYSDRRWFSSSDKKADDKAEGVAVEGEAEGANASEEAIGKTPEELLLEKVAALEVEVKDMKEKVIRSYAEEENVRRIAKRDVDNAKAYALTSFSKSLLEVADNLDLALQSATPRENQTHEQALAGMVEGVQMTQNGMKKVFTQYGLVQYGKVGDEFDPNLHDALFKVPDPEKKSKDGTIGQVIKTGYKMKDRVIRAAMVGTITH